MRRNHYFILDGHVPVVARDIWEWGEWWIEHDKDRIVAQTMVDINLMVSTVFLAINHEFSFDPDAPPVLFETAIFYPDDRGTVIVRRYSTWEEAEDGHWQVVAEVI